MQGAILDVSYEALTSDFEPQCKRLLSFCQLDWEESCLRFHENTAPSMTASLAQVRQPVYTSSVARWKHYRGELSALESLFTQAGLTID